MKARVLLLVPALALALTCTKPDCVSDLFLSNTKSVADWGDSLHIAGTFVTGEGDRVTPNVTEIECRRTYQNWQQKEGPECHEISAGLIPAGSGNFGLSIDHFYYAVQTWDDRERPCRLSRHSVVGDASQPKEHGRHLRAVVEEAGPRGPRRARLTGCW